MRATNSTRGFIALLSVIVISFTLLIAVVAVGYRGIVGRYQLLDLENKQASQALAESCVGVAMIEVSNSAAFSATNVTVPVGDENCTLISVIPNTPASGNSTIKTSGIKNGATTYLKVVLNSSTAGVISWQETPS
jgi:cytoskeletal protein RodZ